MCVWNNLKISDNSGNYPYFLKSLILFMHKYTFEIHQNLLKTHHYNDLYKNRTHTNNTFHWMCPGKKWSLMRGYSPLRALIEDSVVPQDSPLRPQPVLPEVGVNHYCQTCVCEVQRVECSK